MPRKDMSNWYEAGLPAQERKIRGHFSTPPLLVSKILDACGYTVDADLSQLKVLDPACGSGNFLAGVVQRIIASGQQRGMAQKQVLTALQRNVWGVDPDPVACFLAEMQLRTLVTGLKSEPHMLHHQRLHIHQADGLALTWEQTQHRNVDLFLANPPYLAAKNTDLSGYRSTEGLGQVDSYLLFLRLALQVVRPEGWIGLVLPDPVLARANATRERQRLLEETTIHHIWHLSRVFPAYVGAVVIIAQKRPPQPLHSISWVREKWNIHEKAKHALPAFTTSSVAQTLLHAQPGAELRYLLGREYNTLVARLHAHGMQALSAHTMTTLDSFVSIRRGEELGKKSILLTNTLPDEQGWHPLLRGGIDVRAYETPKAHSWIAQETIEKPLARYSTPKLLVVKSTDVLQAALDVHGHVALQTLYLLYVNNKEIKAQNENMAGMGSMTGASPVTTILPSHSGEIVYSSDRACPCHAPDAPNAHIPDPNALSSLDQLYFLLALLNSRLLQQYMYILHTAYKMVQPQIEQHVLARLPVPLVAPELQREIVERAKQIMLACSVASPVVELKQHITLLREEQERTICALYENAIQKADKGVD